MPVMLPVARPCRLLQDPSTCLLLCTTLLGRTLQAAASEDRNWSLWDMGSERARTTWRGPSALRGMAVSPDRVGSYIMSCHFHSVPLNKCTGCFLGLDLCSHVKTFTLAGLDGCGRGTWLMWVVLYFFSRYACAASL